MTNRPNPDTLKPSGMASARRGDAEPSTVGDNRSRIARLERLVAELTDARRKEADDGK